MKYSNFLWEDPMKYHHTTLLELGDFREAKKEYSRLRKIANKRLSALGRSKYANENIYIRNKDRFISVAKMTNEELRKNLPYLMQDVHEFLSSARSSVTGFRESEKQMLETALENGMDFLNKRNIQDFGHYMDYLRSQKIIQRHHFSSERALEVYRTAVINKKINTDEVLENFGFYQANIKRIEQLPRIRNKEKRNADEYRQRIVDLGKRESGYTE